MCISFTVSCWALKTSWPHPVELGPWYGHVAVVLRVVAAACKTLLCQEDQVIVWQATAAVHFCLVLHIESLAQLGPQHLVWNNERHPPLRTWGRVVNIANTKGKKFRSSLSLFIQLSDTLLNWWLWFYKRTVSSPLRVMKYTINKKAWNSTNEPWQGTTVKWKWFQVTSWSSSRECQECAKQ